MSKTDLNAERDRVLDDEVIGTIGESLIATPADPERVDRLRRRVLDQIAEEPARRSLFDTIRGDDGEWIEIMPCVSKKVLQVDRERGIESYLLRMMPGAHIPAHAHESDELCYVIEGDLAFGDIRLKGGDYHFAHRGSEHGDASTVNGALLFLQSGIGGERYEAR